MTQLSRVQEWPQIPQFTNFEGINDWAKKLTMSLEEDAALRLEELAPAQISNYSVMLGVGAGENNNIDVDSNEGLYNIFIGHQAGYSNTTGNNNVAIGYKASYSNATSPSNIAIGRVALTANTKNYNIAIGDSSLTSGTTGHANVAVGHEALSTITTTHNSIALGHQAGKQATGANNVFLGYQAGFYCTGSSSVFIGYQSGVTDRGSNKLYIANSDTATPLIYGEFDNALLKIYGTLYAGATPTLILADGSITDSGGAISFGDENLSTTGTSTLYGDIYTDRWLEQDSNTFIGVDVAGNDGLTHSSGNQGYFNVGIGNEALYSITTGSFNFGLGYQTLKDLTTGAGNMAIGSSAMESNTEGDENVAIGRETLKANTGGDRNVAIGFQSMLNNTTSNDNTAIGYLALSTNTTVGTRNIALGGYALQDSTAGVDNIAIGDHAGQDITEGTSNVCIGTQSNRVGTTGIGNVAIGYRTLYNQTGLFGRYNTILGFQAGDNLTSGSNNVLIGSNVDAVTTTSNDSLNIGNTLYGDLANDNIGISVSAWGTSAAKVFGIGSGTAPSTSPADMFQMYSADIGGVAGRAGVHFRDEGGFIIAIGDGSLILDKTLGKGIKIDLGAPTFGWRDLLGFPTALNTGASKPSFTTYRDTLLEFQFAAGDEEYFVYHVPHDYVPGTDIHLHIHWSHIGTFVTGGTVTFEYEVSYAKGHNQAAFGASVGTTFNGSASTTQYQHIITETQISAGTPDVNQVDSDDLEPDGVIMLRFDLNSNDMTVSEGAVPDPFVHFVDIHYQSTNIATKNKRPNFYS